MPLNEGEVFAGYVIQRLLGTGGVGEVYLAQHPRLPRLDALKVLSLAATDDEEYRARFNREADLAATLWHPHIVGVLDRGEYNGRLWISMDYVDGTDAGRLLREHHSAGMPEHDVLEIVSAVADALDFAHERRMLHRDVKPENILVAMADGQRRRVLLTDFGIARRTDDVSNLTEVNVAVGTISYVAPEQLMGRPLDGRADQYALAATAFHLLTGVPLFVDTNRAVVISHHLSTPAPRLSDRRPELAHLDAVLARALAKNPDDRYPTCLDFARALSQQSAPGETAPLASVDNRGARPHTQRLERIVVHGTARGVHQGSVGAQHDVGMLSLWVEPYDSTGNPPAPIRAEIRTQIVAGQLNDGDDVQVSGVWDGEILDADRIVNLSDGARPKRRSPRSPRPPRSRHAPAKAPRAKTRKLSAGRVAALVAGVGVIALVVVLVVYLTDGFGIGTRTGPMVQPERATVFSPDGAPDNPQSAGLAIDGDPATAWSTVTYTDAVPFPTFIEGMGLILQLPEPTALGAVTIDLSSSGTEVQIRASPSSTPATLADTTELTPTTPLQPGHNRISVDDRTETSHVLVWISTLGTTDGQSRTEISEITVYAAG